MADKNMAGLEKRRFAGWEAGVVVVPVPVMVREIVNLVLRRDRGQI